MTVDEIIKFIQAVGFPIAVAAYVLIRMETTQRELIKAVTSLTALVERVLEKEKRGGGSV